MIDYSTYNTKNPFMRPVIEGRGVPNVIKKYSEHVYSLIIDELKDNNISPIILDIVENNVSINRLSIYIEDNKESNKIYAYSQFGTYTPLKGMENPKIIIQFNFKEYSQSNLKRVILHELLHIYEIYNRMSRGVKKDLQWGANNILTTIRNNHNDHFIQYLVYMIYLSFDHEINARTSEVYAILMELNTKDKNLLKNELSNTSAWMYKDSLNSFDYKKHKIDYNKLLEFFIEFNTMVLKKYKTNFNIYKVPVTDRDCLIILKNWSRLFRQKSLYFEKKLIKVIDEVIDDVKMNESAYVYIDDSKEFAQKYVTKFDKLLDRNYKINKLFREE